MAAAAATDGDAAPETPSSSKEESGASAPTTAAAAADDGDDDLGLSLAVKKKKKPKKKVDLDEEGMAEEGVSTAAAGDGALAGDDDGGLNLGAKKKKKKKPKAEDEEDTDAQTAAGQGGDRSGLGGDDDDGDDDDGGEDLGLPEGAEEEGDMGVAFEDDVSSAQGATISLGGTDRDYKYDELLGRMLQLLHANNPELAGDRKRFVMKPPQVVKDGAKKVVFINFPEICKTMRRSSDHVFSYMLAELGTTGSIDGSGRMVIRGRFMPKAVEHVIRKYVTEYVLCASCKSNDTDLQKENRLYFIQCNNCGARKSVAAITAGFKAQIGRRIRTG